MPRKRRFDTHIAVLLHTLQADRAWRTIQYLSAVTGTRETSLSANLRNLRKPKWGGHRIAKRRLNGVWEYRLC